MPISSVFCCLMTENQLFIWINIGKYEKRTLFDKRTKKINISVVVFFWKYDVKTRCKNFNLLPLFEKNNGIVINKKTFCSQESRIALKTHQSPSLFSMADKCSIQGIKSVGIYLDALFGKIILRSIKTRQKNGHKLCLFMHCNCYARQFTHTKDNFCRSTDNYRQQKAFHTVQ